MLLLSDVEESVAEGGSEERHLELVLLYLSEEAEPKRRFESSLGGSERWVLLLHSGAARNIPILTV